MICRALCDLFNASALTGKIAFRGDTAIHKLVFEQPLRLSRVASVYWRAPCLLSDGGETRDMIDENPSPSIVHENHVLGCCGISRNTSADGLVLLDLMVRHGVLTKSTLAQSLAFCAGRQSVERRSAFSGLRPAPVPAPPARCRQSRLRRR